MASNCPLPPVAGGSVEVKQDIKAPDSPDSPDSAPDGGPLENLSDSELVADLEGLNLIDPVPQIEEHLSDNKYQFRTRRTKMADKIEESSPEDLFQESESDFVPEEDDSESEYEDQIKEPVGGRRRKVGEQIQESVTQHLF